MDVKIDGKDSWGVQLGKLEKHEHIFSSLRNTV